MVMPPSDRQFYCDALREVKTSAVIMPDHAVTGDEFLVRHLSGNATYQDSGRLYNVVGGDNLGRKTVLRFPIFDLTFSVVDLLRCHVGFCHFQIFFLTD